MSETTISMSEQSFEITFSKDILATFAKINNILSIIKDKEVHILFFKDPDNKSIIRVHIQDKNMIFHLQTTTDHINFGIDEIGIANFGDLIETLKAIGYPSAETSIVCKNEKSIREKTNTYYVFKSPRGEYRRIVASPTLFNDLNKHHRKVIKSRDEDPFPMGVKLFFASDEIVRFNKDIALHQKPPVFGFHISDECVKLYLKSLTGQQYTHVMESPNIMLTDYRTRGFKLFPTKVFDCMQVFKTDFEVDVRYNKNGNGEQLAFKCFSSLSDNINIFIGCMESKEQSMISYDVIK